MQDFFISGNIIQVEEKRIFKGKIKISSGFITEVVEDESAPDRFILPGFIDAHVHIESSMLVPSEFARLAVIHGTVATVSDPHEIANVAGMEGIEFMIENGKSVPFKFYFGAPSCVPATSFETSGASISVDDIETLLQRQEIKYLAEMMNWPGVIYHDPEVAAKINLAKRFKKPVDGHAPGLIGDLARHYAAAGITTDHECYTMEEALQKLALGMKILIREGSAAKNFDALIDLLHHYENQVMFCSDDKHPDSLLEGHLDQLVRRALDKKIDLFKILKAACINPILHYGLEVGRLRLYDPADFIVVNNLRDFKVQQTFIQGIKVAENGKTLLRRSEVYPVNNFSTDIKQEKEFQLVASSPVQRVIEVVDGQLITRSLEATLPLRDGLAFPDTAADILKITVVNRYKNAVPAVAFIKGFGLQNGALASSIAHDSHNIIAVGTDDVLLTRAVNEVIRNKGGIAAVHQDELMSLPLPVAGLMSAEEGPLVAERYTLLDEFSKKMGSTLKSPFMSLSFMALLVIPSLKLSDLGLFDGDTFTFLDKGK